MGKLIHPFEFSVVLCTDVLYTFVSYHFIFKELLIMCVLALCT